MLWVEAYRETGAMPDWIKDIASVIRDVGVIVGVPTIITVGMSLHDIQSKALEQQVKANEAQIKVLESQNMVLKETQFDRALTIIKSQKAIYELEKSDLEKRINDLRMLGDERVELLEARLSETRKNTEKSEAAISALGAFRDSVAIGISVERLRDLVKAAQSATFK